MERDPHGDDRIPPQAAAVILVASVVELNFLEAPRPIVRLAAQDAWISTLLAAVGLTLAARISLALASRFPGQTLVEYGRTLTGPVAGSGLVLLFVLFWFVRGMLLLQLMARLITSTLLPETPAWIVTAYLLVAVTYLVWHGLEPMARLFLILLALYLVPLSGMLLSFWPTADPGRFRPLLERGWGPLLEGSWMAFGQAPGTEVLLMIGPWFRTFRGAARAVLAGMALVGLPYATIVALLVAQFGPLDVVQHAWPTLSLMELLEVPGFTGLRVDPVFLLLWSLTVFSSLSVTEFLASVALQRLLSLRLTLAAGAALLLGGTLPISTQNLLVWEEPFRRFMVLLATLILPSLLLLSYLRKAPSVTGSA